jgi:hypothetical protein
LLSDVDDLTAWGYIEEDGRDSFKYTAPVYEEAFRFLGLNPDKDLGGEDGHGPNKAVCFDHFTKTKHDDVDYEVSADYTTSQTHMLTHLL